jgi:large conductance mechanosensitive channel
MLDEFKKFIFKGNIVDLSTGVIIGAAFGGIVKAFTDGVVTPILSLAGGGPQIGLKVGIFDIGIIISAVISFLITAAVVFFVIVKPMNRMVAAMSTPAPDAPPPAPPADVALLTEIRDLLKK